ncbi:MAG: hypothetical protein JSV12_00660, partial [Candidatus Bathyarchaeota archaeon]
VLNYNPSVIQAVSATNGDLITTDVSPFATFLPVIIDNTNGKITVGALFIAMVEPVPITSGPGTLANVTFTVVSVGNSSITLGTGIEETSLKGYTDDGYGDPYDIINGFTGAEHLENGYFNNVPPPIHDVAVTNLTAHPLQLDPGDPSQRIVKINATVANEGDFTETFNVTIKYDSTPIDTQSVNNLLAGHSEIVNFVWNVTDIPLSTYTIEAEAILPGDDDPGDNIMTSDWEIEIVPEFSTLVPLLLMLALFAAYTIALKRKTSNNHLR